MGVFQNNLMGAAAAAASAGGADFYTHQISNSCRFDGAGKFLITNGSAPTNAKKYTFSTWVKRSELGNKGELIAAETDNVNYDDFNFNSSDELEQVSQRTSSYKTSDVRLFRDPSAFYHVVAQWDTSLASATDRLKVYINGVRLTWDQTAYDGALPQDTALKFNENGASLSIGYSVSNSGIFEGYMAQTAGIDGSIVAIGDLGETKNGVWIAKDLSGLTFGNNGFLLDYASSSDMGNDVSGNNNDFTPTSISAHDQMLDSPTFNSSSNGGNFATLNAVYRGDQSADQHYGALSEGNLKLSYVSSGDCYRPATHKTPASGKWYFEYLINAGGGSSGFSPAMGIINPDVYTYADRGSDGSAGSIVYANNVNKVYKDTSISGTYSGSRGDDDDIMGIAVDMDNGAFYVRKNGTWQTIDGGSQGDPTSGASRTGAGATWTPASDYKSGMVPLAAPTGGSTPIITVNFGQDGTFAGEVTAGGNSDTNGYGNFYSSVPSGYSAVCNGALTVASEIDPTQTDDDYPQALFKAKKYTGTGSSNAITGLGFQPDWTWIKTIDVYSDSQLTDSTRGVTKWISSSESDYEGTTAEGLKSFDSDGFTVGTDTEYNDSGESFASMSWRANGGTTASNGTGDITSTVQADPSGCFSIVKYTGSGTAGDTIGHGLSTTPNMIMIKNISSIDSWAVYHSVMGNGAHIELNTSNAYTTSSAYWNSTSPTSTVFTVGTGDALNQSTKNYIAYCFANCEGYIKAGSYVGNADDDGTFVYTGFRPAMIILREYDQADNWPLYDNTRPGYNLSGNSLYTDYRGGGEAAASRAIDFLSNGFKLRTSNATGNASSGNYIYIAMAHNPFKYATAR